MSATVKNEKKDRNTRSIREVEAVRDRDARPTLHRIRRDRAAAPERLKPLLDEIHRSLFDPELDVTELKRRCGIRDNSLAIAFHRAVGRPPFAYLEDRRMEVACRLLARTKLKVWEIAQSLGYSSLQVFSRAFLRWSDERPTAFRHREQARDRDRRRDGGRTARGMRPPDDLVSLRLALRGDATTTEAARLVRRLLERYPDVRARFQ